MKNPLKTPTHNMKHYFVNKLLPGLGKQKVLVLLAVILLGSSTDVIHYYLTSNSSSYRKPTSTQHFKLTPVKVTPTNSVSIQSTTKTNSVTTPKTSTVQQSNTTVPTSIGSQQQIQQYTQEINAEEAKCTTEDQQSISNYTNTVKSYAASLYQFEESTSSSWNSYGQSLVNSSILSTNNDIQSAYNGAVDYLGVCTPSTPVTNPPLYIIPSCNATDGAELQVCASQIYSASGIP